MQNLIHTKSFLFDYARYELSDGKGDDIILHVNYKGNTYGIKTKGKIKNKKFRAEVDQFVADMLFRKHGKNFAKKNN